MIFSIRHLLAVLLFFPFQPISALEKNVLSDKPAQYFRQPAAQGHGDSRFTVANLSSSDRHERLVATVQSYLSTMSSLGVTTWLAHGTLLAWHWGQQLFPWEEDLDMHIHISDLHFLAAYYNMTVWPRDKAGGDFLLDINPNFVERDLRKDWQNKIDARWIDMRTGLYVDITAVQDVDLNGKGKAEDQLLWAKDGHRYERDDVLPLQETLFEGVTAYVPRNAPRFSRREYGANALTNDTYRGYKFDLQLNRWEPIQIEDDAP